MVIARKKIRMKAPARWPRFWRFSSSSNISRRRCNSVINSCVHLYPYDHLFAMSRDRPLLEFDLAPSIPPPSYAAAHDEEEEKDAPPRRWYHLLPTCGMPQTLRCGVHFDITPAFYSDSVISTCTTAVMAYRAHPIPSGCTARPTGILATSLYHIRPYTPRILLSYYDHYTRPRPTISSEDKQRTRRNELDAGFACRRPGLQYPRQVVP